MRIFTLKSLKILEIIYEDIMQGGNRSTPVDMMETCSLSHPVAKYKLIRELYPIVQKMIQLRHISRSIRLILRDMQ